MPTTHRIWLVYEQQEDHSLKLVDYFFDELSAWDWQPSEKPYLIVESRCLGRGLGV